MTSSVYNNVYTANRAIDGSFENNGGNDQSRWVSNRNSNDEYIQIDLEANYDLTGVNFIGKEMVLKNIKFLSLKMEKHGEGLSRREWTTWNCKYPI
ncbi:MAG: discoidin domain-containing protein [Streptococcus sp.]